MSIRAIVQPCRMYDQSSEHVPLELQIECSKSVGICIKLIIRTRMTCTCLVYSRAQIELQSRVGAQLSIGLWTLKYLGSRCGARDCSPI